MLVLLDDWMVVRFVGVIRVRLCARVSRVRPVCVPAPPGVFLPSTVLVGTPPVSYFYRCFWMVGWL